MTSKTGNYISFDRFCEMMDSALQRNNDGSVFLDLLTWQDLEILKARKAAKAGQEPSQQLNATHRTKNKRYIILTYVAEYDRVHYPLALKLDDNSTISKVDKIKNKSKARSNHNNNKRCAIKTARQLLSHTIASTASSSSQSSLTSSPQSSFNHPQQIRNNRAIQHQHQSQQAQNAQNSRNGIKKHYRSTPNLNDDGDNGKNQRQRQSIVHINRLNSKVNDVNNEKLSALMQENMALKLMLKQNQKKNDENQNDQVSPQISGSGNGNKTNKQNKNKEKEYPSDKLTEIIEVLEDEIKVLKQELEKNLEIRRISRSSKQYQEKHVSKRLDDLEDEIERLSTELLQERTKIWRCNREFHIERQQFNKTINH